MKCDQKIHVFFKLRGLRMFDFGFFFPLCWYTCHVKTLKHRITIREVADDAGISFGLCQANFTNVLGMKRVVEVIVPELLNFKQKHRRMDIYP